MAPADHLTRILERKARENVRRAVHAGLVRLPRAPAARSGEDRAAAAHARLRRPEGTAPRVIAEIKHRSPSAGVIRARAPGGVGWLAREYERGGAAAVSVLCDGPGFGGSVLDVRRARAACSLPLLFKEFVLEPGQVTLAREVGAHMVLLIVRALSERALHALCDEVLRQGMAPVVEAADARELSRALSTRAAVIGVNARDLRTFAVDPEQARALVERIPRDRIAVHMSGIASADDLATVARSRADAVLIGEGLMRAEQPGTRLSQWLSPLSSARPSG